MSDLSNEARGLIDAARGAEDPSDAHRERVRRALAVKVALGAAALSTTAKAASTGGIAGWLSGLGGGKLAALGIGVVAMVGAGVAYRGRVAKAPRPPVVAPAAPIRAPTVVPLEPPAVSPPAQPVVAEPAPPPPVRRRPPERAAPPAEAARLASALEMETRLLALARGAAQSGDLPRALSILADYDLRFRQGVLREEFTATRILVLADAGKTGAACAEARAFLVRWPRSPHAPRVRAACPEPSGQQ